jgi:hypothetical protein
MIGLTLAVLSSQLAFAEKQVYQSQDLGKFLQEFYANPAQVMGQLPPKTDHNINQTNNPFKNVTLDRTIEARDLARQKFCKTVNGVEHCLSTPEGRAAISANDRPEDLIDSAREICSGIRDIDTRTNCLQNAVPVTTLAEIEQQKLQEFKLKTNPWSDDYWPIARGVLGHRYADPEKSTSLDWKEAFDWMKSNPATNYVEQNRIEMLSPSEKYDLLVGDQKGTLTKAMWNEGKGYYDESGKVEPWMGICHGWAPAAFMLPRPAKAIELLAADGVTKIPFYPSDIKALGSLLWAKNEVETRFVGGRCNTKDPARDANGRVQDQDCFDNNPGTWHLAVVNQLAKARRSFVLDATFDYEVWNQPVVSYSFRYFNPQTSAIASNHSEAAISLAQYARDPFKKYRATEARKVVGVEMKVEYSVETRPEARTTDSEDLDMTTTATYRYDLELDAAGKIVGGEWYAGAHPDFLWVPVKGKHALGQVDEYLMQQAPSVRWSVGRPVPQEWRQGAVHAARYGTPLALIVERMFEMAQASR